MTINDAFPIFITHGKVDRLYARETVAKFEECFRTWIRPHMGTSATDGVSVLDVMSLKQAMVTKGLSVNRQYSILVLLKIFFRFIRTVLKLPCLDPNEIRLPRRVHRRVEFLTQAEVAQLLDVIKTHTVTGLRMRALVEVLLGTGMRISETLSLNRDSISRETGEADIVGKGNKQRTVFFSAACIAWIDRYLATRKDECPAIFVTTGANPVRLSRDDMSKAFMRLRERSGINKKLTPHLLRHTFCTSLLHGGADITFIKELAGHQDIQTTARYYLGTDKDSLRAVLKRTNAHGWGVGATATRTPSTVGAPA